MRGSIRLERNEVPIDTPAQIGERRVQPHEGIKQRQCRNKSSIQSFKLVVGTPFEIRRRPYTLSLIRVSNLAERNNGRPAVVIGARSCVVANVWNWSDGHYCA